MSFSSFMFRLTASVNDYLRDRKIPLPAGVACHRGVAYRSDQVLDVYYPENTRSPLPTIVSIHGGGYVYGSKEIYRRYGMELARHGFAVVNFNYRLAPKWRFPAPLEDTNAVMEWLCRNGGTYHLDPGRIILVGDSAGAQLASQYAAVVQNPAYAANFAFRVPPITVRALGLNCGMYDLAARAREPREGVFADYLGDSIPQEDPRLQVLGAIGDNYPPTYLATACHDFLRGNAQPMYEFLSAKGIPAVMKCYGSEDKKEVAHVFHVNIRLPEAIACNDDECAFFQRHV